MIVKKLQDFPGRPTFFSEGLCSYTDRDGVHCGFADKDGNIKLPAVYFYRVGERIAPVLAFHSDRCAVLNEEGSFGYIDKEGAAVLPYRYEGATSFANGGAYVKKDGKWGEIDKDGKTLLPFAFDRLYGAQYRIRMAKKDGRIGMIDAAGNTVVPFLYDEAREAFFGFFREDRAILYSGERCVLLDREGRTLRTFPEGTRCLQAFGSTICLARGEEYWLADENGKEIAAIGKPDRLFKGFGDSLLLVRDPYTTALSPDGTTLYEKPFTALGDDQNGLVPVRAGEKYGYANPAGELVIPAEYDGGTAFSEGLAFVRRGDTFGIIDEEGKAMTGFVFDTPSHFREGAAWSQQDGQTVLIRR